MYENVSFFGIKGNIRLVIFCVLDWFKWLNQNVDCSNDTLEINHVPSSHKREARDYGNLSNNITMLVIKSFHIHISFHLSLVIPGVPEKRDVKF